MKTTSLKLAQATSPIDFGTLPKSYSYGFSFSRAAFDSIFVLIVYIFKFFLTFFIELIIFSIWNNKKKDKNITKTVFRVNLFTHPLATFIIWSLNNFKILDLSLGNPFTIYFFILFELIIIYVEWRLYCFALPYSRNQLFWLSILSNSASFMVGYFWIFM
jgi:hypothetical protein